MYVQLQIILLHYKNVRGVLTSMWLSQLQAIELWKNSLLLWPHSPQNCLTEVGTGSAQHRQTVDTAEQMYS